MTISDPLFAVQILMIALCVVTLAWLLWHDLRVEVQLYSGGRAARLRALAQLQSVRLNRLLEHRGISLESYRRRLAPQQFDETVSRCRNCSKVAHCEAVLQGQVKDLHYAYCPNHEAIERVRQQEFLDQPGPASLIAP